MTEEAVRDVPPAHRQAPSVVRRGDPISRVIEQLIERPNGRNVYVVDDEGALVGTVGFRDVLRVTNARYGTPQGSLPGVVRRLRDLMRERAEDLMREATPVHEDTPLVDALALMERTRQNDLPVTDRDGRLVGELNALQVLELARRVFLQTEADLAASRAKADPEADAR